MLGDVLFVVTCLSSRSQVCLVTMLPFGRAFTGRNPWEQGPLDSDWDTIGAITRKKGRKGGEREDGRRKGKRGEQMERSKKKMRK